MDASSSRLIYSALLLPVRNLYREVQAAASACGFLEQGDTTACGGASGEKVASHYPWEPRSFGGSLEANADQHATHGTDSVASWRRRALRGFFTAVWRLEACLPAGVCLVFGMAASYLGGSRAFPIIALPAAILLAMTASWLIAWGLLRIDARRCRKRLHRLFADLRSQHKIAREAVRWLQELEVTFKAFAVLPTETAQSTPAAVLPRIGDVYNQAARGTQREPPHSTGSIAARPSSNSSIKNRGFTGVQRGQVSFGDVPAQALRERLRQLLTWQENVMCSIYEDILRPEARAQSSWWNILSQGPWMYERAGKSDTSCRDTVRSLKDATVRSWAVHSRLSAGVQIALRRLLFLMEPRLHRECMPLDRRRRVEAGRQQLEGLGLSARRSTRMLLSALSSLRQQAGAAGSCKNKLSVAEEIAQATVKNDGISFKGSMQHNNADGDPRPLDANIPSSCLYEQRKQHEQSISASSDTHHGGVACQRLIKCTLKLCLGALSAVQGALDLIGAGCEGLAAAWWLHRQLCELAKAIAAAGQAAETTTRALRTLLEEDWVMCPPLPSQHLAGQGLSTNRVSNYGAGGEDVYFRLARCCTSPPSSACQAFGGLCGNVQPARRIALASMSRHIAASLALLRLPPVSSYHDLDQKRTFSCLSQCSVSFRADGSPCESGHQPQTQGTRRIANADAVELSAVLQLALRHLRVACEEGEKLQQSLCTSVNAVHAGSTRRPDGVTKEASIEVRQCKEVPTQAGEVLQPLVMEPVKCLKIYTAIGQDCSNKSRAYHEEAALLAAFADEDPAARERSRLILPELNVKLQKQQLEIQNMPQILRELSASDSWTRDLKGEDDVENEGIACIVADTQQANADSHGPLDSNIVASCKGSNAFAEQKVTAAPRGPGEADSERSDSYDISKDSKLPGSTQQESVFFASLPQVAEWRESGKSSSASLDSLCEKSGSACSGEKAVTLQMHKQKLCGSLGACYGNSCEEVAARSLISELEGVLTEQLRSCGDRKNLQQCASSAADHRSAASEWHSCVGVDRGEGPTILGEDIGDSNLDPCDLLSGSSSESNANFGTPGVS